MDVRITKSRTLSLSAREDGFTLIESVVAMGLFAGVVFLLVSVFSGFMLDDFPSRSNQALAIAQSEIASVKSAHAFSSSIKDTIGFRVTREVSVENWLTQVIVTVSASNKPSKVYTKLTALCPYR
jgi:type II secretory pathway pseudopilin PulG